MRKISIIITTFAMLSMIGIASAGVAEDLTNFSLITTNFVTIINTVLGIFLTPPLIYFLVLSIVVALIGVVRGLMHRGK